MDAKRFTLHIHRRRAVVKQLNSERQKKNRFRPKPGPSATRILDIGFCPERSHGLVTLSPECFSTFPHGTCALSVSCRCLALDGVYHPPLGCITKQPDSRRPGSGLAPRPHGPDTRSGRAAASFERTSAPGLGRDPDFLTPHLPRARRGPGIRRWALPASLAATGGILVSFFSSA